MPWLEQIGLTKTYNWNPGTQGPGFSKVRWKSYLIFVSLRIKHYPTQQTLHIFGTPNTSLQHLTAEFMFTSTIDKEAEVGREQKWKRGIYIVEGKSGQCQMLSLPLGLSLICSIREILHEFYLGSPLGTPLKLWIFILASVHWWNVRRSEGGNPFPASNEEVTRGVKQIQYLDRGLDAGPPGLHQA